VPDDLVLDAVIAAVGRVAGLELASSAKEVEVLAAVADAAPAGVEEVRLAVEVGDHLAGAASSIDAIATVTACGATYNDVRHTLISAGSWLQRDLLIEEE